MGGVTGGRGVTGVFLFYFVLLSAGCCHLQPYLPKPSCARFQVLVILPVHPGMAFCAHLSLSLSLARAHALSRPPLSPLYLCVWLQAFGFESDEEDEFLGGSGKTIVGFGRNQSSQSRMSIDSQFGFNQNPSGRSGWPLQSGDITQPTRADQDTGVTFRRRPSVQ